MVCDSPIRDSSVCPGIVSGFGLVGILFMRRIPPTVAESPLKRATAKRYLNLDIMEH